MMARRIQDVCIGASQPLILAPENASTLIYAVESFGGYDLHLGNPNDEPDYPTLRDFIEERGFDPDDDIVFAFGLGCQDCKPQRWWQPNPRLTALSIPVTRSYCERGPDSQLQA